MKGVVKNIKGTPDPNSFEIEGEDSNIYFSHIGDISDNEYQLYNDQRTVYVNTGDSVEFDIAPQKPRAIRVIKK